MSNRSTTIQPSKDGTKTLIVEVKVTEQRQYVWPSPSERFAARRAGRAARKGK